MAEVLAPIQVQQPGSITMLHPSPDHFSGPSPTQSHGQPSRLSPMPRTHIHNTQNVGYRGTSTPISPYAFQATPQLRLDHRTLSAPGGSSVHGAGSINGSHSGQSHASSISTNASSVSTSSSYTSFIPDRVSSKDDMALSAAGSQAARRDQRPMSSINFTSSVPDLSLPSFTFESAHKPSPNRYRRTQQRQDSSSSSPVVTAVDASSTTAGANVSTFDFAPSPKLSLTAFEPSTRAGHVRTASDDVTAPRPGSMDQAKRYRRRSLGGFETGVGADAPRPSSPGNSPFSQQSTSHVVARPPKSQEVRLVDPGVVTPQRPIVEKRESHQSTKGTAHRSSPRPSSPLARGESNATNTVSAAVTSKRLVNPSPLSKPMTADNYGSDEVLIAKPKPSTDSDNDGLAPPSPAVQHLAALSDKDFNAGKKSRLRRAFSFGSAAELRKASAQNAHVEKERAKLTKEMPEADRREAEDAAVAAKQEAAGIGNSIYSGQGGVFASSTDNISISSTASSASLMLRKMGQGVKKGARSVKGLFRPKSVIGVPAADGPVSQPTAAQVSMVTAEAERERVNVTADPHERNGGTGFPHLERNSLDAGNVAEALQSTSIIQRKSIVGSDAERDEVLRAVRKGILKRTATAPAYSTNSSASTDYSLPNVPHVLDSPVSSTPGSPANEHGPTLSSSFPNPSGSRPDYFSAHMSRPFAAQSTRSLPNTPNGSRNIAFNPRIQFHDVWSPTEYDRRGDIATCNRLTPMLAQQIKEELNSFKMEMEVHELSKPHTHFF